MDRGYPRARGKYLQTALSVECLTALKTAYSTGPVRQQKYFFPVYS